jgi:hypothetical protein
MNLLDRMQEIKKNAPPQGGSLSDRMQAIKAKRQGGDTSFGAGLRLDDREADYDSVADSPIEGIRQVGQGYTLGFGDELESAVKSVPALLTGGLDKAKEKYTESQSNLKTRREAYEEKHPLASLYLQIVPPMVTPGAAGLGMERLALKAPQAALKVLRSGKTDGKLLLEGMEKYRKLKSLTKKQRAARELAKKIGASTGRGALYGGVYGAGRADAGDRIDSAIDSGMMGGGISAALSPILPAAKFLNRRRVAQSLGKGEEHIPLSVAGNEEGQRGLAQSTMDFLGEGFIPNYRKQMEKVSDRVSEQYRKTSNQVARAEEVAGRQRSKLYKMFNKKGDAELRKKVDNSLLQKQKLEEDLTALHNRQNSNINAAEKEAISSQISATESKIKDIDSGLMNHIVDNALPVGLNDAERAAYKGLTPWETMKKLRRQAYLQVGLIIFTLIAVALTYQAILLFILWAEIVLHKKYQDKIIEDARGCEDEDY